MDDLELKKLVEDGNKTIEAIRGEVAELKKGDPLTEQKMAKMEADLAATLSAKAAEELQRKALEERIREMETKMARPGNRGFETGETQAQAEHKAAFLEFARKGGDGGIGQKLFDLQSKAADVQVATAASGGYALPKQLSDGLLKQLVDISPIRSLATVVNVSTTDYHDLIDVNGFASEWLGETSTHNQTNTPSLADVVPTWGELAAKPEATRWSIQDLNFDVASWLMQRGAEAFAVAEGVAFISGNGTNKPTGFLTGTPVATADAGRAFGTLQYVASGQASALAANPFLTTKDMVAGLKAGYRRNGTWVMNSLTQAALAKIVDSQGRFLMQYSVSAGQPDMMEGYPVAIAEDMPVIAANAFPIAFGDFRAGYLVADIPGIWMTRDDVTKTGYVRFAMGKRVGGKLRDSNAIKLMKIAIS
jgi:HK97 family phage major capsid protein